MTTLSEQETQVKGSELKEAPPSLPDNDIFLRTLVEVSTDAVVVVDHEGRFRYTNLAHERLTGYTATEVAGQPFFMLVHPDDHTLAIGTLTALTQHPEQVTALEIRLRQKDGGTRFVEASGKALPDGNFVGYLRDITRRKQAEDALRESEERFRSLVEISTEGVVLVDSAGCYIYTNPTFERISGYPQAELLGQPFIPHIYPDDLPTTMDAFTKLLTGRETTVTAAYRFIRKDGVVRFADGIGRALPNDQIVAFIRDTTDRKEAEAKLRQSEAYYRSIIENATDGLTIASNTGTLNYVSPAFERLFGYSAAELVGQSPALLMYPDDMEQAYTDYLRMVANPGQPIVSEGRLRHKNGEWLFVESSCKILPSGEILGNFRDITDRKEAEEKLRELNAQLEQRVKERTAALEAALAKSRRLSALIEATTDFVGMADLQGRPIYLNRAGRRMVGIGDDCR